MPFLNADGSYQLDVDPGTYDIHFDPPSGSSLNPIVREALVATTDQTVNVQLSPLAHTMSGTVRDGDGNPLPSMQVIFRNLSANSNLTIITDGNGHYSEGPQSVGVTVLYDTTAPTVGDPAVSVEPIHTDEAADVQASASDTGPGGVAGSGVAAGEYFIDADPGVGQGVSMTLDGATWPRPYRPACPSVRTRSACGRATPRATGATRSQ